MRAFSVRSCLASRKHRLLFHKILEKKTPDRRSVLPFGIVRLLIAREAGDGEEYATGGIEVVFDGLGEASSVDVALYSDLDGVEFADAIVEFT